MAPKKAADPLVLKKYLLPYIWFPCFTNLVPGRFPKPVLPMPVCFILQTFV